MKKLMNKKGNKQGVILVIVLFILAMAMIFISAALMLTNATRSRVYKNAESDQARLTVTAAAEAFYRALEIQEIQDAQLQKLANANSTLNMSYTGSTIPGLTEDANNKTTVHIYHPSGVSSRYVYCDFTTIIDDQTENARIVLFENDPPDPKGLFVNQLDYNGSQDNNFRANIGKVQTGVTGKNNSIVYRGDFRSNQSNSIIAASEIYFIGKKNGAKTTVKFENNEIFNGDVFFLDNVYMSWDSTSPTFNGDMYFIGKSGNDGAFNGNFSAGREGYSSKGTTWTFMNRKVNVSSTYANIGIGALKGSDATLLVDNSGDWKVSLADDLKSDSSANGYLNTWKGKLSSKSSNVATAKKAINKAKDVGDYPTTSDIEETGVPIKKADVLNAKTVKLDDLISTSGNLHYVDSGNYIINSSYVNHVKNYGQAQVIFLNGQADYTFFIEKSITMEGVLFVTVNPSAKHSAYFLLADGVNMQISDDQSKSRLADGKYPLATGFISIKRSSTDLNTLYNLVRNESIADQDKYHNGKAMPTTYIYGLGNNKINVYGGTCIEAYVGLFDNSYPSSSTLTLTNFGDKDKVFSYYGRIMATNIVNSSGTFDIPYCPAPSSDDGSDEEIESLYKVVDFLYYY